MKFEEIVPIIGRFNPFFTEHTWDDASKTETARLDPMRLLAIKQKACKRHHVLFSMMIDPSVITNTEQFWITESLVMLKRVFFQNSEYLTYKKKLEKEYVRQFLANGVNQAFTFPVDDRTFICKVEYGSWGAKIRIEAIKLILREKIKIPGISRDQDDAWFQEDAPSDEN